MKSLKERLEEKIEKEAEVFSSTAWTKAVGKQVKAQGSGDYIEGAASLVPLILELAEALEQYSDGDKTPVATDALQSIEKFLEGK